MQLTQSFEGTANTVALANAKVGMLGVRLMTRVEYRKAHGLGRAEAEKQHNAYLRQEGLKANQNIAARIAGGELLITGIKEYESGKGQIAFVSADKVVDKAPAPVVAAVSTQDEALALLGLSREQFELLKAAGK